jgi:hypothetical protein
MGLVGVEAGGTKRDNGTLKEGAAGAGTLGQGE